MYDLLISSHSPTINEQDVNRNEIIKIYLNDEIDTSAIGNNNIVVTDYLYTPVAGVVGYEYTDSGTISGIANILTFTPDTFLDPETTYSVFVNKYPDSVKSINDNYIQQTYTYKFYTGIEIGEIVDPTDQLEKDLAIAVAKGDWCEVARISALLSIQEKDSCGVIIPPGLIPPVLDDDLMLLTHWPLHMQSNIPLDELRFIKLEFNDIMPSNSGVDYNNYISVTTKGVLE